MKGFNEWNKFITRNAKVIILVRGILKAQDNQDNFFDEPLNGLIRYLEPKLLK